MPFLALAIALLLAGPVYGGDCSGTAPNDLCETGRPALTASSLTLSGRSSDGSGTARRSKPSRSPKVHSAISAVASAIEVRRSTESTPPGLKTLSTKLVRVNEAGEIHVYVVLTEWRPEHVAELEALGLRVEAMVPARRLIQGWVPSQALDDVAALDAVREVKRPAYGMREGAAAAPRMASPGVFTAPAPSRMPYAGGFTSLTASRAAMSSTARLGTHPWMRRRVGTVASTRRPRASSWATCSGRHSVRTT